MNKIDNISGLTWDEYGNPSPIIDNKQQTMTWDDKVEMCQHLNSSEYTEATNLFLKNIDILDDQAVDMFVSGIELTKECLSKDIGSHKIIAEKIKNRKTDSMRTAIRMALYEELTYKGGEQ